MIETDDLISPAFGEEIPAAFPSADSRRMLHLRRSTSADMLGPPGPDAQTLEKILTIAARVPDHRKVTPFRFIVIEREGHLRAQEILAAAFVAANPDAPADRAAIESARLSRAPVVVAVVAAPAEAHRTPVWEQTLTVGAVCHNMLLAASAHGYAAQWLTEWYSYDDRVAAQFGLSASERFAGFVHIGSAKEPPRERQRPALQAITKRL